MGLFDAFKTKQNIDSDMLDDMSYIADLKHFEGPWNQYDFLLASQGYGWDYILDSAEYMINAELEHIGTVSVSKVLGANEVELIDELNSAGGSIKKMKSLAEEAGALGIGGMSKIVGGPVKIVWINQTRVIRIFTPANDEDLLTRYAESVIRRNFGTADAMKKGKPVS